MPSVNPVHDITTVGVISVNDVTPASSQSQNTKTDATVASTKYWYEQSMYYAGQAAESAQTASNAAQQAQQDVDEIVTKMKGVGTIHLDKAGRAITISTVNYVHEQDVASDEWTINHNLGKRPSVVIVDSSGKEFYPPVTHISDNTCIVEPIGAMTGIAYLN